MRKIQVLAAIFLFILSFSEVISQDTVPRASPWAIDVSRRFSRDIFKMNGVPYLQPMVEAVNATSNSRFFSLAYVPRKVDKPYFKFGLHSMLGFVREDMKTYKPEFPMEELTFNEAAKYAEIINQTVNIKDTAGLIYYLFKTILYDGVQRGSLFPPDKAATILGSKTTSLVLYPDTLRSIIKDNPIYGFLTEDMQDSVLNAVTALPAFFTLPQGGNINTIFASVPQVEIGSLFGTELLLRGIPPVYMGENIGDFAFWGIGIKHSISQYFNQNYYDSETRSEDPFLPKEIPNLGRNAFNLAVQLVYQGTHLENTVGVTNSELKSNATFWNFNIHASQNIEGIVDIYSGFSLETMSISTDFTYYLPVEVQGQLGLLLMIYYPDGTSFIGDTDPENGYPGDTEPQYSTIKIKDTNIKWVIGAAKEIGPIVIFADFSISQFNIFTGGILYKF